MKTTQFWSGCQIRNLRKSGSLPGEPAVVRNCDGPVQLNVTTNPDSENTSQKFLHFAIFFIVPGASVDVTVDPVGQDTSQKFLHFAKIFMSLAPHSKVTTEWKCSETRKLREFLFRCRWDISDEFFANRRTDSVSFRQFRYRLITVHSRLDVSVAIFANRRIMSISLRQFFLR